MKEVTKKKIEIGLWIANLIAFIIINLCVLRTFHWVMALIMAAAPVVTIVLFVRHKYYNVGFSVLIAFSLLLVWLFTVSFLDKTATVNSPDKYVSEIADSGYEFFPDSLPEDAVNREFYRFPGLWLAKSNAYVRFETTKEYLDEYEQQYKSEASKVTSVDLWTERHLESSRICNRINDDYLNTDNCDVYAKAEGFSIQGYAINRDNNEIFIFYEGFD